MPSVAETAAMNGTTPETAMTEPGALESAVVVTQGEPAEAAPAEPSQTAPSSDA